MASSASPRVAVAAAVNYEDYLRLSTAIKEEAEAHMDNPFGNLPALVRLRDRIYTLAVEMGLLPQPSSDEEQQQLTIASMNLRQARYITHINTSGSRDHRIYHNALCPSQPPALKNYGYAPRHGATDVIQVPMLRNYHQGSSLVAAERFSPDVWPRVPREVREMAGNLDGLNVDFFCLTMDCRQIANATTQARPAVLAPHRWAVPNLKPGDSKRRTLEMGLVPLCGIRPAEDKDALPFGALKKQSIHAHAEPKGSKNPDNMRYSPDNAHFLFDPTTPFAAFWSVIIDREHNRAVVSRILTVTNSEDPYAAILLDAAKGRKNMHEQYLAQYNALGQLNQVLFGPIFDAIDAGDAKAATKLVKQLPDWHRESILQQIRVIKRLPDGISARAAFENDPKIDKRHHLNREEQIAAIEGHVYAIGDLLIYSGSKSSRNRC